MFPCTYWHAASAITERKVTKAEKMLAGCKHCWFPKGLITLRAAADTATKDFNMEKCQSEIFKTPFEDCGQPLVEVVVQDACHLRSVHTVSKGLLNLSAAEQEHKS